MSNEPSGNELSSLVDRVERTPKDTALRLELGRQLVELGRFDEAIPHLQQARSDPRIRRDVVILIRESFLGLGLPDLAAEIQKELEDRPDDEEPSSSGVRAPLIPNNPSGDSAAKRLPRDEDETSR